MATPGGLPQGGAPDGARRPLRAAGDHASSTPPAPIPGIGAEERGQAEAIARSTEACLALGVPERRGGHRRGRLGRRHRDRHRQQGADARARDLHRDLARGRGLDPVARSAPGAGRGDQHEDHGAGPAALRRHRRHRRRSRPAARIATRRPPSRRPATPSQAALARASATCRRDEIRAPTARQVPGDRPEGCKRRADRVNGRVDHASAKVASPSR